LNKQAVRTLILHSSFK